jgi:hypothetical protein
MPTTLSADIITGLEVVRGPLFDSGGAVLNVRHTDFGAAGDGRMVSDGNVTQGSAVVTSATAAWTAADVGKPISVTIRPTDTADKLLATTIQAVNSATQITLATAMTATSTQADLIWGTDDTAAIQSAINAASAAGGGTVFVPPPADPGRFYLVRRAAGLAGALRMQSHVRLTGHRYGSRIKLLGASLNYTRVITMTAETQVEIDHLTIDGSHLQQNRVPTASPPYEHLHGISLYKDEATGIGCTEVTLHDLDVIDCRGDGVSVSQLAEIVRIERCLIRGCGRCGIAGSTTQGLTILDNDLRDHPSAIHWEPDQAVNVWGTVVTHNRIANCGGSIDVAAHDGAHVLQPVIAFNHIRDCAAGIRVAHSTDAIVAFNQLRDITASQGMYIYGDTHRPRLVGNVVDGVAGGIGIDVITTQTYVTLPVTDAEMIGNTVRNVTGAPGYGIRASALRGITIQGGLVERCDGAGVSLVARPGEIHRYDVRGATIRNNNTVGLLVGALSGADAAGNVSVTGCHFADDQVVPTQSEGIRLQVNGGSWQRVMLLQNTFDGLTLPIRRSGTFVIEDFVIDLTNAGSGLPTVTTATARPTDRALSWRVGDRILNTAPAAGGWAGWIVTTAGRSHLDSLGDRTSGQPTVANVTNIATWAVGDAIRGAGIPSGTTVAAVDSVNNVLTLSANATATSVQQPLYDAVFKGFGAIEA